MPEISKAVGVVTAQAADMYLSMAPLNHSDVINPREIEGTCKIVRPGVKSKSALALLHLTLGPDAC
ncbi:hypothetical protein DERF_012991 [Dermatophagoides farinae]|uniref:Uncharacterized protein n=1 Tax=Dermatophagoides farinae TaxID=6954 RepID=A0A922HNK1_DERFA|nr:hypothetical protein DERF_012991 [Dermatophagoides farinae]